MPWWTLIAFFVWLATTVALFELHERRQKRYRRFYLQKVCPRCQYPLAGLDKSKTNEITCPECGAKWSVDLLLAGGGN